MARTLAVATSWGQQSTVLVQGNKHDSCNNRVHQPEFDRIGTNMLKVNRTNRTFSRLNSPSFADAQILERTDLQECIFNSSGEFFAEIGERVFVLGKEVSPSQTVQDRIDILAIDPDGTLVIVELKRGSNKLQMLQAVSYAGMIARWSADDVRNLVTAEQWDALTDFLDVDTDDMNRSQRLLLVAERYDFALLAGAEWLNEQYGVNIRCTAVTLATDPSTSAEYMACSSVFPAPALAEQAAARNRTPHSAKPLKWSDWEEALRGIENAELQCFAREELELGREQYLRRRGFHYRMAGKRRWSISCRRKTAYVWQRGRFEDDELFWKECIGEMAAVKPVKSGTALSFNLHVTADFHAFRNAVCSNPGNFQWYGNGTVPADDIEDDTDDD